MITVEHSHTHAHHQQLDGARPNLIENIYIRTHLVLRSPRKLRKEGYQWDDITDQRRIKLIRDEITEIEQRLGSTGKFDELRPLQQEFFINRFAHEQDILPETHHDHEEHSHGEACTHDHILLNRFIKNPKVKKIAAGVLCQFDCTIPAALNILGALFGGVQGAEHHDVSATLPSSPKIVFEYQGKQLAAIPVNRPVTQNELQQFRPAIRTLIEGHIILPPATQLKLSKRHARKEAQRQIANETRWQNWLAKNHPVLQQDTHEQYVGRHRLALAS